MSYLVASYMFNEIQIPKDIKISFDCYDTCTQYIRQRLCIYRIIYRTIFYGMINLTLSFSKLR